MTEANWEATRNPSSLLDFEHHRRRETPTPARRLRLYICACCYRLPLGEQSGLLAEVITMTERFADRKASASEFNRLRGRLTHAGERLGDWPPSAIGCAVSPNAQLWSAASRITQLLATGGAPAAAVGERYDAERGRCAELVRDIFGNPFRPLAFDPAWRTTDAMLLAQGIYEERAFERMPILADALQDAGCDSDDNSLPPRGGNLLGHLRDPHAVHVRGCWALDLVLGKE